MDYSKRVACPENEELAMYLLNKRQEMAQSAKGISDNMDFTFYKAYSNVCSFKNPIKTLRELSQIKGVGKWILKQMQGHFAIDPGSLDDDLTKNGNKNEGRNKNKGPKRYVPQKNSVAYAMLISLFRGTKNGAEYMHKTELIDAAETSGLSRVLIAPEKAKGKGGHFGSSPKDWYSGWTCMKTLITRGLVVKSSCPAKYMLTEEGKEVARECLLRSGIVESPKSLDHLGESSSLNPSDRLIVDFQDDLPGLEINVVTSVKKAVTIPNELKKQMASDVPAECLDKFFGMDFSQQRIIHQFSEVTETSSRNDVPCQARFSNGKNVSLLAVASSGFQKQTRTLKACSSMIQDHAMNTNNFQVSEARPNTLAMLLPPLTCGEKFEDAYKVILILDDREHFTTQGSRSQKIIDNICSQFQIQIEIRRLPVGDCIWIARHKYLHSEFVLDFIVERKKVDDLRHSIRDNRYRDQKRRLLRCGLKKMIYLVEGDPNSSEAAESLKTACFTTEVLEGFDVQRTIGLADTLRKYGFLTKAINQCYRSLDPEQKNQGLCPSFDEFIRRCDELDKMTVSDIFAVQLMQVPHVTEDIALAVIDTYPTLLSLAKAYSALDGDICAQEEMLMKQSNNLINRQASKNVYQLVWGN